MSGWMPQPWDHDLSQSQESVADPTVPPGTPKIYHLNHFEVYSIVVGTFTLWCNQCLELISWKGNSLPIEQLPIPQPCTWQPPFHFLSLGIRLLLGPCLWNPTVFVFLWPVDFTYVMSPRPIHVVEHPVSFLWKPEQHSHVVHPFICHGTLGFLLPSGFCEVCCSKHGRVNASLRPCFQFFELGIQKCHCCMIR